MPSGKIKVCAVLLLALVGIRFVNSLWVLAVVALSANTEEISAAFTSTTEERIKRALTLPEGKESPDFIFHRFRLLEKHVEEGAKVYCVYDFEGLAGAANAITFASLLVLLYPRDLQLSETIPSPENTQAEGAPVYALDLRAVKPGIPPQGYERIAELNGNVLWRLKKAPR